MVSRAGWAPEVQDVPITVRWCGWESRTDSLKRQGWTVFASESLSHTQMARELHLGLTSPQKDFVIAGMFLLGAEIVYDRRGGDFAIMERLAYGGIDMQQYKISDVIVQYKPAPAHVDAWMGMRPIDGFLSVPHYEPNEAHYVMRDFPFFKYDESPKEIYLPQASVDQCLNQILKLQFPQQQDLKKVRRPVAQAKIYSLVE